MPNDRDGSLDAVRVLVVEDDAASQVVLLGVLEEAGFCVTDRASGEQAIEVLEAPGDGYAALLTDIGLARGGATGWDVARRARELYPTLPVVYMTGESAAEWASSGVPNSILLTKPFAPAQAVTAVSQLLNQGAQPAG